MLRISLSVVFLAHALVRLFTEGSIATFTTYLSNKGFVLSGAIVWAITVFEIVGGISMAIGYGVRWLAAGFIGMLIAGIFIIHLRQGWFVGEHGSGGCEYSFILIISLLVVAAHAKNRKRI